MKQTVGTFLQLGGRSVMECLARGGFDYTIIDTEHAPFSVETAADLICAAEAAGIAPYVRIGDVRRINVLRMLDVGARALIVPNIETVEQVRQLIDHAKFPPLGRRGYCTTRTSGWGFDEWSRDVGNYMAECNRRTMLIPQCETVGAVEHIEEIAALDGVDGIFVGPCDLSIALGVPMQMDAPVLVDAIERVLCACKRAGKLSMIFAGTPANARQWLDSGFDSVACGLDAAIFTGACRDLVAAVRQEG